MFFSRFLRQACALGLLAVVTPAVASAQSAPDEKGGQPPQQGGRGDRQGGGRGGFSFGGFGNRGPGGGMTMRFDRAMLLGIDQVRTELKIEESQAAVIDSALDAYREERNSAPRPDRDAFQTMSEEERTKAFEEMQKQREELSRKTDEVLNALLEPAQTTRLDQIALQMRLSSGLAQALQSDDLKGKLKINDDQVAKLKEAETVAQEEMRKMMEDMRGAFQGGRPGGQGAPGAPGAPGAANGFEAMREKMEAARKKTSEAAMAVLTDAQKTQLEEMKGAAFEIDMRAMMGGRGGFGGPGGGPGGQGGQGGRGQGGPGGQGGQGGRTRGGRPQTE